MLLQTESSWQPPQGWPAALVENLGLPLWRIPVTIAAAIGIYVAFVILVRIFGSRILHAVTSFDAVVVIMFGAVAGRVIIGDPPSLGAGVVGLTTLMALEVVFGRFNRWLKFRRVLANRAIVVVAAGRPLRDNMRRAHISPEDLAPALRKAGVYRMSDAQCVILEPSGQLSVIRAGVQLDEEILADVDGAEFVVDPEVAGDSRVGPEQGQEVAGNADAKPDTGE